MSKNYSSTYLYTKYNDYEKQLFDFIMNGEQISKVSDAFANIKYEVKQRQISNTLIKVLESNNVILLIGNRQLPKTFKVFAAKDIKGDRKLKVFIDCTNLIGMDNGVYKCSEIDILIAYLVSAMNTIIYYMAPNKIINNNTLVEEGARCFSSLFTHIVDYVSKISIMSNVKNKCIYLSAAYYMSNILEKDYYDTESVRAIARRISGLSEREEEIIKIQLKDDSFLNIKYFVQTISDILKINSITLDIVLEKWMYLYGTGTAFALEMYPDFASMITDAYVGCYINNQKTIEKITGRDMVDFTKTLLRVGDDI